MSKIGSLLNNIATGDLGKMVGANLKSAGAGLASGLGTVKVETSSAIKSETLMSIGAVIAFLMLIYISALKTKKYR